METRGKRIAHVRKAMGFKSQAGFAEALSAVLKARGAQPVTRGAIGNWELDGGIDLANLQLISEVSDASMDWLNVERGRPPDGERLALLGAKLKLAVPQPRPSNMIMLDEARRRFPDNIPMLGTVAAAMLGHGAFLLTDEPVDSLPLLPGLVGEKGVYGLRVKGDSMYPMFSDGDPIYVSTLREPHRDDIVVIQERDSANGQPQGFVKQYLRETASQLFARQFNPDSKMIFEKRRGIERHRVYTRRELIG